MIDKPKKKKAQVTGANSVRANTIRELDRGGRGKSYYKPHKDPMAFTPGAAAPRVGGPAPTPVVGVPKGGTKKQIKQSISNVRKSAASPQAKRSAKKLYRSL